MEGAASGNPTGSDPVSQPSLGRNLGEQLFPPSCGLAAEFAVDFHLAESSGSIKSSDIWAIGLMI